MTPHHTDDWLEEGQFDIWIELDRIVPHYPEDDDDLGEIRRLINVRLDAAGIEHAE